MTAEMIGVFLLLVVLIILFITEWLPIDVVAIGTMVVLLVSGLITPQQGIMGFSNQATITILALMFIAVGLEQSGAIANFAQIIKPLLKQKSGVLTAGVMTLSGVISAFISTTAVVIVFMKVLVSQKNHLNVPLSKILIPLSYAGILGGSCTLIGTSTNLIVNASARDLGQESFTLFEFTGVGLIFFFVGLLYMLLIGRHILPGKETKESIKDEYGLQGYLTRVKINRNSRLVGQAVKDSVFRSDPELALLEVRHPSRPARFAEDSEVFRSGDVLLIKASLSKIRSIYKREGLTFFGNQEEADIEPARLIDTDEEVSVVEILVRPESRLIGSRMNYDMFKRDFTIIPLAIKKGKQLIQSQLEDLRIEVGDVLLVQLRSSMVERLLNSFDFIVINQIDDFVVKKRSATYAILIFLGVIFTAALGIFPIMISALTGAFLMMVFKCINLHKAYHQIDWSIIFLLAGMIPLGSAMSNTGATQFLAHEFISLTDGASPMIVIGALFGITVFLSGFVSNNATAVLLTPIAIAIAADLNIEPKALLLTVLLASNMSFFTPIGYQTNTLIFGTGNYRFRDFIYTGGILTIIVLILAMIVIPWIYF